MSHITLSILIGSIAIGSTIHTEAPQEKSKFFAWLKTRNAYATTATPKQRLLASVGVSVGTLAATLGRFGTIGGYKLSLTQKLGPVSSYVFLAIPGMFLALCSGAFLFNSAQGWYAKLHSFANSCGIFSGATSFVLGINSVLNGESDKAMLWGAWAVIATVDGITSNLEDNPKLQKVRTEQD